MKLKKPKIRPRVLILIASNELGGPGKGVIQFLKSVTEADGQFFLSDFWFKKQPPTEFFYRAKEQQWPLFILHQKWTYDLSLVWQTYNFVKENGINIVQTHGDKPNFIAFFLKGLVKVKWLAFFHGFTSERSLKIYTYKRLEPYILRFTDRIIAVSEAQKNLLLSKGLKSSKVLKIYNSIEETFGIDSSQGLIQNAGCDIACPTIAVIGRLSPEKGQRYALECLKDLLSVFPRLKLVLIGDGPEKQNLLMYAKKLDVEQAVVFKGYVENISAHLSSFDVLMVPSLSEGIPNVILEAFAAGTPIVATRVGGIPEMIDHGLDGILVPPGDAKALSKGALEILNDKGKQRALVENAKMKVTDKFSLEKRKISILEVYRDLLENK